MLLRILYHHLMHIGNRAGLVREQTLLENFGGYDYLTDLLPPGYLAYWGFRHLISNFEHIGSLYLTNILHQWIRDTADSRAASSSFKHL